MTEGLAPRLLRGGGALSIMMVGWLVFISKATWALPELTVGRKFTVNLGKTRRHDLRSSDMHVHQKSITESCRCCQHHPVWTLFWA